MKTHKTSGIAAALSAIAMIPSAPAVTLFATSYEGQRIVQVDTVTNTVTLIRDTAPAGYSPDSLLFDGSGNIVYTALAGGTVQRYNPSTLVDTQLAPGLNNPSDLALEPSGTSVLVSDLNSNVIRRVNLTGGTTVLTTLPLGSHSDGLAYTTTGRLFAAVDNSQVWEIDPVTGAQLNSSALPSGFILDGMTYDPYTGHLWVSGSGTSELIELPLTLATHSIHALPPLLLPDGIVGDGAGLLYFASRKSFNIWQYDITTGLSTPLTYVYGLDDLAPVAGLGAYSPEPASLALLAIGSAAAMRRRR